MAKNKNQKQERRQPMESRSAQPQGQEQVKVAAAGPQQETLPSDAPNASRKRQKKLGHN